MDILNLEKIYNLRFYIFTMRFIFLAIALVIFDILKNEFGIFHMYTFFAIIGMVLACGISELLVRFKPKLRHAQKLYGEGKVVEAYEVYNELQSQILLPGERFILDLHKAKLFFEQGNYKRFLTLLDELSLKVEKYPKEETFYRLLKAFYFEIKNEWKDAKKELEIIYESSNDHHLRLRIQ